MNAALRPGFLQNPRPSRRLIFSGLGLVLCIVGGCGGSSKPQISSITFTTDATGSTPICTTAMTSQTPAGTPLCSAALLPQLTVGGPEVYLFADVANDDQYLGVSWTVTCGSATPVGSGSLNTACGTFTPAITTSGPVPLYTTTGIVSTFSAPSALPKGGTVTIIAHATSLPSVTSSITLPITAAPSAAKPAARAQQALEAEVAAGAVPSSAGNEARNGATELWARKSTAEPAREGRSAQ